MKLSVESSINSERSVVADAKEIGFQQFIQTISKTMVGFPVICAVILWLVHDKAPTQNMVSWAIGFFVFWVFSLFVYRRILKAGSNISKHRVMVAMVIAFEGVLFGSMFYAFMGYDAELDTWAMLYLIGIISLVLPTYITYPQAFYVLLTITWVSSVVAMLLILDRFELASKVVFTMLVYFLGLVYVMQPISQRVRAGIALQLQNNRLNEQLKDSLEKASNLANTDALTGLYNRRALNEMLADLVHKAQTSDSTFALLMMDMDYFKSINDEYGHDIGDAALQHAANSIKSGLRYGDLCARYGGEEFVVLLPRADRSDAFVVAERIRSILEASVFEPIDRPITVSVGAAIFEPGMDFDKILKVADEQVFVSKKNGRNQVSMS